MASDLTFTGERSLPDCSRQIAYEYWYSYTFARRFAVGRRVLDAACGEGYGTAFLGAIAASTVGVDIDAAMVAHAKLTYGNGDRVRFVEGSVAKLACPTPRSIWSCPSRPSSTCTPPGRVLYRLAEAAARRASGTLVNRRRT